MTQYSKINFIYRLQKWMDSVPGQTFLNYAYSWGASIVILGTLFKLTHLPGANFMLFLGMGTEVIVFFISAFDRPFDKTTIGMDLPTSLSERGEEEDVDEDYEPGDEEPTAVEPVHTGGHTAPAVVGGGTIIIGGQPATGNVAAAVGTPVEGDAAAPQVIGGGPAIVGQSAENTPELVVAQGNYVEALNSLTETLKKVSEQSARLTTDSEEMENLNRTLTGICKVYELQLKSASQQIGTIDQINDQTRRMAEQIEQLNQIYARMIQAMTANLNNQ